MTTERRIDHGARARVNYVQELRRYAAVLREAANAAGLRKDAARYLSTEAERIDREADANLDIAMRQCGAERIAR